MVFSSTCVTQGQIKVNIIPTVGMITKKEPKKEPSAFNNIIVYYCRHQGWINCRNPPLYDVAKKGGRQMIADAPPELSNMVRKWLYHSTRKIPSDLDRFLRLPTELIREAMRRYRKHG